MLGRRVRVGLGLGRRGGGFYVGVGVSVRVVSVRRMGWVEGWRGGMDGVEWGGMEWRE